jgi:hypothetical protein
MLEDDGSGGLLDPHIFRLNIWLNSSMVGLVIRYVRVQYLVEFRNNGLSL